MSRPVDAARYPSLPLFVDCREDDCGLWDNGNCGLQVGECIIGAEECPKCASRWMVLHYRPETDDADALHHTCSRCGYWWVGPCAPPETEETAAQSGE